LVLGFLVRGFLGSAVLGAPAFDGDERPDRFDAAKGHEWIKVA
jgi:hypothetical protein